MADFTYQLSQPSNQIQPRAMPAESGSLGAIASLANNILVPMVQEYKASEDNKILDDLSQSLDKEFRDLAEARKQGKLSSSQFFSRLNVKARQLGADFPELADKWRGRVKEEFGGNLQQQAVQAEVQSLATEDQVFEEAYSEALKYGLGVYRNGSIDKDETVKRMTDIRRQQLIATVAGKDNNSTEVNSAMQKIFNNNMDTVMGQAEELANANIPEAEKALRIQEMFNEKEQAFFQENLLPILGQSALKPEDTKKIREEFTSQFNMMRDFLVSDDKGMFRSKRRALDEVTKVMGDDLKTIMPELMAMKSALGDRAIEQAVVSAVQLGGQAQGRDLRSKLDVINRVKDNYEVMLGSKKITDIPIENRKPVVSTLIEMEKQLSPEFKLKDKDQRTYLNSIGGLTKAALDSGARKDKEKQLEILNKDTTFMHLKDGLSSNQEDVTRQTVLDAGELASGFLKKEQVQLFDDIASDLKVRGATKPIGNVAYNPITGKLEIQFNEEETKKAAEFQRFVTKEVTGYAVPLDVEGLKKAYSSKVASKLKPFNDALDVAVKSTSIVGTDKFPDKVRRQYIVDTLEYPSLKRYTIKSLETGIPSLMTEEVTIAPLDNAVE